MEIVVNNLIPLKTLEIHFIKLAIKVNVILELIEVNLIKCLSF